MSLPFVRRTPETPALHKHRDLGPITVLDEAEVAKLAEVLTGSVQTGYGNSFIGDAVAKALAERVLKADYVPPTRFYSAPEAAIQAAERRGELRGAERAVKELEEAYAHEREVNQRSARRGAEMIAAIEAVIHG